jgi:hypothetical protein
MEDQPLIDTFTLVIFVILEKQLCLQFLYEWRMKYVHLCNITSIWLWIKVFIYLSLAFQLQNFKKMLPTIFGDIL